MFLRYFEQISMPLNKLNKKKACQEFQDVVPIEVLEQVFLWYTQPSTEHVESGGISSNDIANSCDAKLLYYRATIPVA
jgi:hypothetical protein